MKKLWGQIITVKFKKQFLHFKTRQHKTKLAVSWVVFGFCGVLLRYKNFESQTEPKYNVPKLNTLNPSLFFKQTSRSENCFPRKEKPKCNIASAPLSLIYDRGNRLTNTTEHRVAQNTVWKYLNIKKIENRKRMISWIKALQL